MFWTNTSSQHGLWRWSAKLFQAIHWPPLVIRAAPSSCNLQGRTTSHFTQAQAEKVFIANTVHTHARGWIVDCKKNISTHCNPTIGNARPRCHANKSSSSFCSATSSISRFPPRLGPTGVSVCFSETKFIRSSFLPCAILDANHRQAGAFIWRFIRRRAEGAAARSSNYAWLNLLPFELMEFFIHMLILRLGRTKLYR